MGCIFLQCEAVARFCNAISSLFADAMIGQILILRRGDRPKPCGTRAEAARAQASFAPNNAGRRLDPSSSSVYASSSASAREHSVARRAPRYGRPRSHRRRSPHPHQRPQAPRRRACVSCQHAPPAPLGMASSNCVSSDHMPSTPAVIF